MTEHRKEAIARKTYQVNDTKLSVLEAGEPGNPVAFLIHGIPANARLWTRTIEALENRGYFVVAPDLPGFGGTEAGSETGYGINNSAKLFNSWIKQQGWENIWLIAHDIGGGVAQAMLVEGESRFDKVTLSNSITADTWPVPAMQGLIDMAEAGQFEAAAASGGVAKELGPFIRSTFIHKEAINDEILNAIFLDSKLMDSDGRKEFANLLRSLTSKDTLGNMGALKSVTTPVTLIWAMQDPHQSWSGPGAILEGTFINVSVHQIEQAGHFLQIDAEQEYISLLLGE